MKVNTDVKPILIIPVLSLVLGILIVLTLGIVLYNLTAGEENLEQPEPYKFSNLSSLSGFKDALDKAEQAKNETDLLRERLIEQGYSEEALDGLLASGAESAIQLPYIAAVKEIYGTTWNIPLNVGDFTLVDLYVVGGRFVLGQYEDETVERAIWLHMSVTESYEELQVGLTYTRKNMADEYMEYIENGGNIVGFSFWVSQDETFVRYVATASFLITPDIIERFIGNIVDGELGKAGKEPN